jgi:hypothetical protein
MADSAHPSPAIFSPSFFFISVGAGPFFILLMCLVLFYLYHPPPAGHAFIPLISFALTELPESRLFAVGMSLIAWFCVPVFLVTSRMLTLQCRVRECDNKSSVVVAGRLLIMSAVLSFLGLLGLASVSIQECYQFHVGAAVTFLVAQSLFFWCADIQMLHAGRGITALDWAWDLFCPILFAVSIGVCGTGTQRVELLNFAGGIQYVAAVALFAKYLRLWKKLGRIGLLLTRKSD